MTSRRDDFETLVELACAEPVSGWRFPFLEGRRVVEPLGWDYSELAREVVSGAETVLDHGTGGGEVLADIGRGSGVTVATEAWPPNVPVAAKTLAGLGIRVVQVEHGTFDTRGPSDEYPDRRMPFADNTFDVVLARHVAFSPAEICRILRPGGVLLTQMGRVVARRPGQIELTDYFPGTTGPSWPPLDWTALLADGGLVIEDYREQLQRTKFLDIGGGLTATGWSILARATKPG
ncbi:class I SAM-dependent methyltransferase [Kribbella sp. NPDC051952]|uniref:class I SAM-dependent methyltransferase n=1 Tax=Kribbella sp. NPDC051952 TaxID=3154851 RepID=UPI003422A218